MAEVVDVIGALLFVIIGLPMCILILYLTGEMYYRVFGMMISHFSKKE